MDKQFIDWFYNEVYAEPNHNRNHWIRQYADMQRQVCRDWWMRQAFKAGYEQALKDKDEQIVNVR